MNIFTRNTALSYNESLTFQCELVHYIIDPIARKGTIAVKGHCERTVLVE